MNINFLELLNSLISPLLIYPEDLKIEVLEDEADFKSYKVLVRKEDIGRVIGKNGKLASAIRTIVYAGATKAGIKIKVEFENL